MEWHPHPQIPYSQLVVRRDYLSEFINILKKKLNHSGQMNYLKKYFCKIIKKGSIFVTLT